MPVQIGRLDCTGPQSGYRRLRLSTFQHQACMVEVMQLRDHATQRTDSHLASRHTSTFARQTEQHYA